MQVHPFIYLFNLAFAHPVWTGIIAYWIYNAAVDSLPAPNGSKGYRFLYAFMNKIAGNLSVAFGSKIPGVVQPPSPQNK